jgi:hypothetical protein
MKIDVDTNPKKIYRQIGAIRMPLLVTHYGQVTNPKLDDRFVMGHLNGLLCMSVLPGRFVITAPVGWYMSFPKVY